MKRLLTISSLSLMAIFPVVADESTELPEELTVEPLIKLTPEHLEELLDEKIVGEKNRFTINPGPLAPIISRPELSGKRIGRDGILVCEGYLSRVESEDYCEERIPDDWQPFEFDGRTFFMIPLTDKRG